MIKKIALFFLVISISTGGVFAQTGGVADNTTTSTCPQIYYYEGGVAKVSSLSQYLNSNFTNNSANNASDTTVLDYGAGYTVKKSRSQLLTEFQNNYYKSLSCPPKITDLQAVFIRIMVIVNTIIGLVLFSVLVRAGFTRMTARSNAEAVKKSGLMITNSIIGFMIVIGAYVGLVFIGQTLLTGDSCTKYSFVDSGKIVFFFDQSTIAPLVDTANPQCTTPLTNNTTTP